MGNSDKLSPVAVARGLTIEFNIMHYGGQLWIKEDGIYRPAEFKLRNYIKLIMEDDFSSHFCKEVFFALEAEVRREEVATNPYFIPFRNGVLNWIEKKFYGYEAPEVKDLIFLYQFNVNFDPNAQCPRILKFLKEVVPSEGDREILLQFLGLCLIPVVRFEKALILLGEGANGKSTLLKLFGEILGRESFSALSWHDLESRFHPAELVGKLVNIFADLPSKPLTETSIFKAIVSGDIIQVERKFGHPFKFKPFARLIFSTNKLPDTPDISLAFFRRLLIIEFPNQFLGDDCDLGLLDKLLEPNELSGFVNLLLSSLTQLYERGGFVESEAMQRLKKKYRDENNPVAVFVTEKCRVDPEAEVGKSELYEVFLRFCKSEGLRSFSRTAFNRELKKVIPVSEIISEGSRKWKGVALV